MSKGSSKLIYINGRFLTQNISGVQRYGIELIKAIDALLTIDPEVFKNIKFILIVPKSKLKTSLSLKNIVIKQGGYFSGYLWEQFELPFFSRDGLLFCPGNMAPLLSLLSRQRVVTTVHDLSYKYFPEAYSFFYRLWYNLATPIILRRSNLIITVSKSEKTAIINLYNFVASTIVSIQNGSLDFSVYKNKTLNYKTDSPPYLLYLGSLSRRKNLQGFLDACKLIASRFQSNVNFYIVGQMDRAFISDEFKIDPTLSERINFLGQINNTEKIFQIYNNAKALVFPSFYEASPLPPIEAMSCGCPVVAGDIPSLRERCSDAAIYCNPHDSVDIAEVCLSLLSDKKAHNQLKVKGYEQAKKYNWEKCAMDTVFNLMKFVKN